MKNLLFATLFILSISILNAQDENLKLSKIDSTSFNQPDSLNMEFNSTELKGKEKREFKQQNKTDKKAAKRAAIDVKTDRNHVVTLNVLAIPLGKYSLDYEYRVSNKSTVGLNLGIPNKTSIPTQLTDELPSDLLINSSEYQGSSYRGHYRFYTGKRGAPRGLYIEPYLKYHEYKGDFEGAYDDAGIPRNGRATFKLNGFGGGFQLGSQFLIGNRVAIDWSFIGLDLTSTDLELVYTDKSSNPDKSYLDDLRDDLDDLVNDLGDADLPFDYSDKFVASGGSADGFVKVEGDKAPLPGVRFAIGIGYAF